MRHLRIPRYPVIAIAVSLAAAVPLLAGPVTAAPPNKITPESCAAQGGVYSETKNTRTCTVSYVREDGQPAEIVYGPTEPFEQVPTISGSYYQVWLVWDNYQVTQTCTQKGGKKATCTTSETYLSTSKMRGICQFEAMDNGGTYAADPQDCIDRGLWPALGDNVVIVPTRG